MRAERDHPGGEREHAPTTEVSGISRPRIQTLPFIMNGRGMSGSMMRSQMIDGLGHHERDQDAEAVERRQGQRLLAGVERRRRR